MFRSGRTRLFAALSVLSLTYSTFGQITNVTEDQNPPIEGASHDYIRMLSETVMPATGALSIRIQVPVPQSRGFTVPFSFGYDSNIAQHVGVGGTSGTSYLESGGWKYDTPQLTFAAKQYLQSSGGVGSVCQYSTDYVLDDLRGSTHALGISVAQLQNQGNCSFYPRNWLYQYFVGGDAKLQATTSAWSYPSGASSAAPVTVADMDGTIYYFSNTGGRVELGTAPSATSLPDWIEDRNGNKAVFTDSGNGRFTITDTAGRTAISSSGFGATGNTITASGLSGPYILTWGSVSPTYTLHYTMPFSISADGGCAGLGPSLSPFAAVTKIVLPNGQSYQFQYDATTGLLSKIVYPTGAYVRYAWAPNTLSEVVTYPARNDPNWGVDCEGQYDTLAVQHRYVSFDGVHEVLRQDFSYSTTWPAPGPGGYISGWTSKQTNVVTNDLARGTSFTTSYTYAFSSVPAQPNDPSWLGSGSLPVETQIVYKDTNGATLRTVNKAYFDPLLPPNETDILDNGQTSETAYAYTSLFQGFWSNPPTDQGVSCSASSSQECWLAVLTDEYEYDYGAAGSPGPILKHTHYDYHTFGTDPLFTSPYSSIPPPPTILDRPSDVITYNGSGTRVAETDYSYDGTATSSVPSVTQHDETNYGTSYNVRGNATTKTVQCIGCTNAITTYAYDETGKIVSQTDPCGNTTCGDMGGSSHTTTYGYGDSYTFLSGGQNTPYTPSGNTNAYLTSITNPLGHTQHFTYDFNNGELTVSKDENSQISTYLYNDSLARPTQAVFPDLGQTSISYNDAGPSPSVAISELINSNTTETTVKIMDGMGHPVRNELTTDPNGTVYTDTTYDGLGRTYTVSNPYYSTSDSTYGITTYTYDSLGRNKAVQNPDGTTRTNLYTGRATLASDEGNGTHNVQRVSQADALGRLTGVCEVTSTTLPVGSNPTPGPCNLDISANGFPTTYTYDILNNLLSASQGSLSGRSFSYDSLSRLTSATNPESGTITYTYDANGNVSSKTAPLPNQTNPANTVVIKHSYDVLNRLTSTWYTDTTPTNYFAYDQTSAWGNTLTNTIGRMTSESRTAAPQNSQFIFSYDPMGRVANEWGCTPINCGSNSFAFPYTYDYAGNLTSAGNGLGTIITYGPYNGANEPTAVTSSLSDSNHPGTLMSGIQYSPLGKFITAAVGNSAIYEHFTYSNRAFPTSFWACTVAGQCGSNTWLYTYAVQGQAPNSDVLNATDTVNSTWTYTYDDFNRLSTAVATNGLGCNWDYDRYGNRWHQNPYQGSCNAPMFSFTGNNNRIDSYSYDAAGNLLNDGTHNYTYDAENRIIQVDGGNTASYVYDAEGKRIQKTTSGTTVDYLYDLDGHEMTEVSSSGVWNRGEVYANGLHLATYRNGTTYFNFADWLGTERSRATVTGQVCETIASLPFGDNQTISGSCADTGPMHFTGKERDSESSLDYFGARHYASSMGRFMTVDQAADETIPVPLPFADSRNPQSLNLYSYALNNPTSNVDPDGHDVHVCVDNDKGGQNCFNMSDQQYADLQKQQNGQNGVNMPGGSMPGGNITCSAQVCGSASYFEPGLQDTSLDLAMFVGGVVSIGRGLIEGGLGLLRGAGEAGAGTAAREAGVALAEKTVVSGGKAAIRDALENGAVNELQKQAVKRALARGAAGDTFTLTKLADGSVKITTEVAGRAGGRAVYEKVIDAAGQTSSVVQKAYDASGNLVHDDPKFP
jgi:RHS repeat-associated protein